ncbi:6-carboxytetrahydropterin synthase [Porphyromonadaceae bacterium W3.11]|nr:6-carboxytetrahydropterin synthase [Porphyromonadaceae bacterium W3.11]
MIRAERYHDISCGHRVVNHESKCRFLHGHNYRIHFGVEANDLDELGRVLDFSVIKSVLCDWLETHWDHKFLIWQEDPLLPELEKISPESLNVVPFNPTAENMALYLLHDVAPALLDPYQCRLTSCRIEETRKCSVSAEL